MLSLHVLDLPNEAVLDSNSQIFDVFVSVQKPNNLLYLIVHFPTTISVQTKHKVIHINCLILQLLQFVLAN